MAVAPQRPRARGEAGVETLQGRPSRHRSSACFNRKTLYAAPVLALVLAAGCTSATTGSATSTSLAHSLASTWASTTTAPPASATSTTTTTGTGSPSSGSGSRAPSATSGQSGSSVAPAASEPSAQNPTASPSASPTTTQPAPTTTTTTQLQTVEYEANAETCVNPPAECGELVPSSLSVVYSDSSGNLQQTTVIARPGSGLIIATVQLPSGTPVRVQRPTDGREWS